VSPRDVEEGTGNHCRQQQEERRSEGYGDARLLAAEEDGCGSLVIAVPVTSPADDEQSCSCSFSGCRGSQSRSDAWQIPGAAFVQAKRLRAVKSRQTTRYIS
jgi:hypothetical protein